MYFATSTTQLNYVQIPGNRPYLMIYFVTFIIFGAFFLMNLFVGVVIIRFQKQKENVSGYSLLSVQQQEWVDIKMQYLSAKPIKAVIPPNNAFRKMCYRIISSKYFDNFILVCIIINTIILPVKWYQEPEVIVNVFEYLNYVLTAIFIIESTIKITALPLRYFHDAWNIFDFIINIGSIVSIIISANSNFNLKGATSIIRSFKVCRILRLIEKAKRLKVVFNTFLISLPAMANVGGLLFLIIYLYAILGVFLFGEVAITGVQTDTLNFQSFWKAFLILFVVATGDGWNDIMLTVLGQNTL